MKRIGQRGEGRWQRISWDEALDTTAERFKEIERKYGPDSIVLATGTKRGTWPDYLMRFANAWGKQWTSTGWAQCALPRLSAGPMVLGGSAAECPDFSKTNAILVWGANPPEQLASPRRAPDGGLVQGRPAHRRRPRAQGNVVQGRYLASIKARNGCGPGPGVHQRHHP